MRASLIAAVLAVAAAAHADEVELRVRARTRLHIDTIIHDRALGELRVSGQLIDSASGQGLPGRGVDLQLNGPSVPRTPQRHTIATTDGAGHFVQTWPLAEMPRDGQLGGAQLRVRFDGDDDCAAAPPLAQDIGLRSGPTGTISGKPSDERLSAAPPPGDPVQPSPRSPTQPPAPRETATISWQYYLVPPMSSAFLIGAMQLGSWLQQRRRTRRVVASAHRPAPPHREHRATRRLLVTGDPRCLGGQVCDDETGRPIAAARVHLIALSHRDDERSDHGDAGDRPPDTAGSALGFAVDADGCFLLTLLAPCTYHVRIEAPGYFPAQRRVQLPHHGALDFTLAPMRSRILELFYAAARTCLAAPGSPAATPRELLQLADPEQATCHTALGHLTALTEESCFSSRPVTHAVIAHAERLASQACGAATPPTSPSGAT